MASVCIGWLVIGSGACEKESPPAVPASTTAPAASSIPIEAPTAATSQPDDTGVPPWLPKPEEILGWIRIAGVQVIRPGEWNGQRNRLRDNIEAFSFKSALRFEYKSTLPEPGGAVAAVTVAEMRRSDDAFGLATCMMPVQPRDNLVGSMSCVEHADSGLIVHGWQGNYYIHVALDLHGAPEPLVSVEKLAAGLLRPIPSAGAPELLKLFPPGRRIPGWVWVTSTHLQVLPRRIQKEVLRGSALETTKALALGADTMMAVVAYDPGDGEAPNYVWIVQYPLDGAAVDTMGRYKSLLRKIKPAPMVLMDIPRNEEGKPTGRYLCGTWTADQESIMHILPQIVAKLPNP